MTTNDGTDRIEERIRKLLALANNNTNVEEATLAAAKAQSLAFQHNIDLEAMRNKDSKGRTFTQLRVRLGRRGTAAWHGVLVEGVAKANRCRTLRWSGVADDYYNYGMIFGAEHDVKIVEFMYQYLEAEIRRLANIGWKQAQSSTRTKQHSWKNGFCFGAAREVEQRLEAQKRADEDGAKANGQFALVLASDAAVQEAFALAFPDLREGRTVRVDGDAYNKGREAGKGIAFRRALEG
jgi:hypothetical protein